LKNDATLINYNRNLPERFQHIQVVQGKQLTEVGELHAGDIGAIAKLKETTTGETLGDKGSPIYYSPAQLPEPSITFAIEPKTAPMKTKSAFPFIKSSRKIRRYASCAIRKPRNSCSPARASNTLKSSSPSSTSAITLTSP